MANMIKLRLKDGAREIEIEGESRGDIESILDKYWKRPTATEVQFEEPEEQTDEETPGAKKRAARRPRRAPKDKSENPPTDPDLEPHVIANKIKDNAQNEVFRRKVLNVRAEYVRKASLILWIAGKPMTSGQVHRALEALDIKVGLPRISEALNKHEFMTTGQRGLGAPAGYRLTAPAKEEFEKWLLADGS